MPDFKIDTQKLPNNIVSIAIKGFLDAYTYNELEQTIQGFFKQDIYKLIVDLSEVDYISSAGAGVFIGAFSVAQENNGNIILVQVRPSVKEVFDLLGLSQIFTVTDNVEMALKIFKA